MASEPRTAEDRLREIARLIGDLIFTDTASDPGEDGDVEVVDGVVTRFVIVAEIMDSEQRWLCTRSADASGEPLPHWDVAGLMAVGG